MSDKIYKPSSQFWLELFPDGMTAADIDKELADLEFVSENISKVYMHVTGEMASKPMIYAEVINSLHDDFITQYVNDTIEEVIELIETKKGYPSVFTTWDNGVAEGVTQELVKDIRETFGVPKKCLPFGQK